MADIIVAPINLQMLEEMHRAQWLASAVDPKYFIFNFCYTVDEDDPNPDKAEKVFPYKNYLAFTIDEWINAKVPFFIEKSRQILITWLMMALHLWLLLFHPHRKVLYQTIDLDASEELVGRTSYMYKKLPQFMREFVRLEVDNLLKLQFSNGSNLRGLPSQVDSGKKLRGKTVSAVLFDENAFQEYFKGAFEAVISSAGKTGRITAVTTPNMSYAYEVIHDINRRR